MSSEEELPLDPLESAARGATKGALDWSLEKIKELATRFRNRELAFIEDRETIIIAKEQRQTSECKIFTQNVEDRDLHILFQMGLTLKRLEKDNDKKKMSELERKIFNKYRKKGLHIAHVVQNGIFNKYIGNRLDRSVTPDQLKSDIDDLFFRIENIVVFISTRDKSKQRAREIVARLNSNSPDTFIISSMGSAMGKCRIVYENVKKQVSEYTCECYKSEDKLIYFLNKKDI